MGGFFKDFNIFVFYIILHFVLLRAPEDGYYMFTLVVRERLDNQCAGSVMKTPASDPNNALMLCRAEHGYDQFQTGTCTVRMSY